MSEFVDFGALTMPQMFGVSLATVAFVLLWALGIIPVDISLGRRRRRSSKHHDSQAPLAEISTFLLDCPLQFVCDVDAWANRDHEYFMERVLASWFRNPNQTWHHKNAAVFGGGGTCKEMYPCPFDVQEVVGIRIPGSNYLTSEGNEVNEEESLSFF